MGQRFNKHDGLQIWRRARTPFSRLVYEIDDDVFHVGPENWNAYRLYAREDIRDAVMHSAEVADVVTVTTEHLASVMREFNPNVAVLPNHIPGWLLNRTRPQRKRPSIGWQGGASHGVDVTTITKPVRQFIRRFPGWDLRLIGTDYRPTFRVKTDRASYSHWIPIWDDAEGFYGLMDFDIGLVPLLETQFSKSKSALKALEYAALGIPSIATDCEVYRAFIRHGENGFLAKYEHEWLEYMSMLASDDDLRLKMGSAAKESARKYSIGVGWRRWAAAYKDLFRVPRPAS